MKSTTTAAELWDAFIQKNDTPFLSKQTINVVRLFAKAIDDNYELHIKFRGEDEESKV